jgi:hypothetical protein
MNFNQMQMREKSVLLVILIFYMSSALAQEAVLAAGGDATGGGGSAAYAVGQILYSSSSDASGEVFQGVQQPYEIMVISGLDQFEDLNLIISTYPNPVSDLLILKVESLERNDLNFKMYNSNGRIVFSDKLLKTQTNIDMSHLAPGAYFLHVIMEQEAVKTFKIIKK